MLFNSFSFVIFLAIVLPLYYALNHRWQNRMLLLASWVFYGSWNWRFLSLLLLSTVVDYHVARALDRTESLARRKLLLAISVVLNLGILGTFKYFNFFIASFNDLLHALGIDGLGCTLNVILPVGISFYTFQTMSYTIDVYRRQLKSVSDFPTLPCSWVTFRSWWPAPSNERAIYCLESCENARSRPRTWFPLCS